MKPTEIDFIGQVADLCRKKGIRKIDVHGLWAFELGPQESELKSDSKPLVDSEVCNCHHPMHAHNNGLCLQGCGPEQCMGPEQ